MKKKVLNEIKTSQNQHGLRHGDYQRYRQYCTRRIARIRKALHFPQIPAKKKPTKTQITPEVVTDSRLDYFVNTSTILKPFFFLKKKCVLKISSSGTNASRKGMGTWNATKRRG